MSFTLLTTFHHAGCTRRDLFLVNPISLDSYNSRLDQDKVNGYGEFCMACRSSVPDAKDWFDRNIGIQCLEESVFIYLLSYEILFAFIQLNYGDTVIVLPSNLKCPVPLFSNMASKFEIGSSRPTTA